MKSLNLPTDTEKQKKINKQEKQTIAKRYHLTAIESLARNDVDLEFCFNPYAAAQIPRDRVVLIASCFKRRREEELACFY